MVIELSAETAATPDIIVKQFIASLEAQNKAVFAGYMVWEKPSWVEPTIQDKSLGFNSEGHLAPVVKPPSWRSRVINC